MADRNILILDHLLYRCPLFDLSWGGSNARVAEHVFIDELDRVALDARLADRDCHVAGGGGRRDLPLGAKG